MLHLTALLISIFFFQNSELVCLGNRPIGDWVDFEWGDRLPQNAVKGGYDQTTSLFICRAFNHTLSMKYCGKTSKFGRCWVDHKGKEKAIKKFQILTGVYGFWVPVFSKKDKIPCNSLRITEINGKDIYSGRHFEHSLKTLNLGSVIDSINYVTYEDEVFQFEKNFEIFTALPRHIMLKANETSKKYITDGNFISFRVKRKGDITISMGPSGSELFYEIVFPADSRRIEFKDNKLDRERTLYFNYYKNSEFEGYWIYFRGNIIRIGIEGNLDFFMEIDTEDDADIIILKFTSNDKSTWHIPYFDECRATS